MVIVKNNDRRTLKDTAFLFVTLVAAGWMFAPTLTSNLCSEATNRNAVSFRVLTMAEAVNLANF